MGAGNYGWDGGVSIDGVSRQTNGADFGKKGTIAERQGTRGTREHSVDDTREGTYTVSGNIPLEPSGEDLATDLALAIGTATAQPTEADVIVDRVNACYTYADCVVDTLTLSGSQGGIIKEVLGLVGTTEAATGTVAAPSEEVPLMFHDCAFTVGSVTCTPFEFELVINNDIDKGRFVNAQTLAETSSQDQIVTLKLVVPNDSTHAALYDALKDGTKGGTIVIANCGTITFGALQAPTESAPLPGKEEVKLTFNLQARASTGGATPAIAFVAATGS